MKSFRTCRQAKERNNKLYSLPQTIQHTESKCKVITMDFIHPLPWTKKENSSILNVFCKWSKMIRIIPTKTNSTAPEFAVKFEEHVYYNHGMSSKIKSEREARAEIREFASVSHLRLVFLSLSSDVSLKNVNNIPWHGHNKHLRFGSTVCMVSVHTRGNRRSSRFHRF